jgi:phosphopantetheinyl transferase (holo-ACP synthase)
VVTSDASLVPQVSISHADGVAVAAASFARIGIDIATIEHQQASFIDETFCDNELAAWAAWLRAEPTSPLTVTTAFAVKEAALKWLGTGFGTPLRAIQIVPVESSSDRNAARGSYSTPLLRGTLTDRSQRSPRAVSLTHSRMGAMVLMSVCGTIA